MFSTVKFWVITLIGVLIAVALFFTVMDNFVPNTNDAYLYARVAQIAPRVKGPVTHVYVTVNKSVKKGEPLFQIDPRLYQIQVNKYSAALVKSIYLVKEYTHTLQVSQQAVASLIAQVDEAKNYVLRYARLAEQGAASKLMAIRYKDKYLSLQDKLEAARQREKKLSNVLQAKVGGENVIVRSAKANLAHAKYQLSHTLIRAPSDGYVTNITLTVGRYAKEGDPVMVFVDTSKWWVVANIDENHMRRIKEGQLAYFTPSLLPGKIFQGHVDRIAKGINIQRAVPPVYLPFVPKTIDWIQIAERFPIWIRVDPQKVGSYSLRVGSSAHVIIHVTNHRFINSIAYAILWMKSYLNFI